MTPPNRKYPGKENTTVNGLQWSMGFNPETGAYRRPFMLRRAAQLFILADRKITQADIARDLGTSRQIMNLYFEGRTQQGPRTGETWEEFELRRDAFEDRVERSIEKLSKEKRFLAPRVVGTPDEDYISDAVILPDLMRPHS